MSSRFDRSTSDDDARSAGRERFERLCAPLKADLLRFLIWLSRDRFLAEDVMQETLLRAWRSMDSLTDPGAVKPWLLTIARRELARVYERKQLPMTDLTSAMESHDSALAVHETHEVIDMRRAIGKLEVTYREPLVMQVLLGLSTEEIAQQLEISTPAVLTRLFRARQLLKQLLDGGGERR